MTLQGYIDDELAYFVERKKKATFPEAKRHWQSKIKQNRRYSQEIQELRVGIRLLVVKSRAYNDAHFVTYNEALKDVFALIGENK